MTHYCQYWRALFRRRRDHFLRMGAWRVAEPMAKFDYLGAI
jgi:hypothetical protein